MIKTLCWSLSIMLPYFSADKPWACLIFWFRKAFLMSLSAKGGGMGGGGVELYAEERGECVCVCVDGAGGEGVGGGLSAVYFLH